MLRTVVILGLAAALLGGCADGEDGDRGGKAKRPPVVVLVFDEFPTDALLRPTARSTPSAIPNFAALARTSTWFPNAFTIYDSTFKAVPAILDGVAAAAGTAADQRSTSRSFTPHGPARVRRGRRGVGVRALSAAPSARGRGSGARAS